MKQTNISPNSSDSGNSLVLSVKRLVSEKRYQEALYLMTTPNNNNDRNDNLLECIFRAMFADWGTQLRQ